MQLHPLHPLWRRPWTDLANRFGISAPYMAMILGSRLAILATAARQLIIWPLKSRPRQICPRALSARGDLLRTWVVVNCLVLRDLH